MLGIHRLFMNEVRREIEGTATDKTSYSCRDVDVTLFCVQHSRVKTNRLSYRYEKIPVFPFNLLKFFVEILSEQFYD